MNQDGPSENLRAPWAMPLGCLLIRDLLGATSPSAVSYPGMQK